MLRTWPTKVIWVMAVLSILKSAPEKASSASRICLTVTGRRDSSWYDCGTLESRWKERERASFFSYFAALTAWL